MLLVYVNDVLIGGRNKDEMHKLMEYLGKTSNIGGLGPPRFLGIEIARSNKVTSLC